MKKISFYYVNKGTCMIMPVDNNTSRVVELDNTFLVEKSVHSIIEDSCIYFGSTYNGRFIGSKKILNMNYKLPIVIEEFNSLIFFPTSSPRFKDCIWISLNNISKYLKNENGSSIVFNNDLEFNLDISFYSLENLVFRATLLDSLIRKRKLN